MKPGATPFNSPPGCCEKRPDRQRREKVAMTNNDSKKPPRSPSSRMRLKSPEASVRRVDNSSTSLSKVGSELKGPDAVGMKIKFIDSKKDDSQTKETIDPEKKSIVSRLDNSNSKSNFCPKSPNIASPTIMVGSPAALTTLSNGRLHSVGGRARCDTQMSRQTLSKLQSEESSDTEDETLDDELSESSLTASAARLHVGTAKGEKEKGCSFNTKRHRMRSFDPNRSFAVTECDKWDNEGRDLSASCRTLSLEKPLCTTSIGPAMTQRLRRNSDSVTQDVAVALKIKKRLEGRLQENRMVFANTALSDFIRQTLTGEQTLDAEAAAQPTSAQVLKAAGMARKSIIEGYFASVDDPELEKKVQRAFLVSLRREEYHKGDEICREGEPGDKLFVIEEGTVQFVRGNHLAGTASSGSVFGDTALVFGISRDSTVTVTSPTVIAWTLDELNFRRIQGIMANATIDLIDGGKLQKKASRLLDMQENIKSPHRKERNGILLGDLEKKKVLGKGSYGIVYKVGHKTKRGSETEYALKSLSKKEIVEKKNQERVVIERNILQALSGSPFIIEILGTYQDTDSLYILSDLAEGGSFFAYLGQKQKVSQKEAVFMAGCLASGLVHVHKKGFVHRDLKPENCLIGADGYLKICDFGLAKRLPSTVLLPNGATGVVSKAFTLCGTPEFTAPEMLLGSGYDHNVDWWAFACLLAEMIDGSSPFSFIGDDECINIMKQVACIGMGKSEFELSELMEYDPKWEPAASLVSALLVPEKDRLGRARNSDILDHDFFESIDFDLLKEKKISPPAKPYITEITSSDKLKAELENVRKASESVKKFDGDNKWCEDF